MWTQFVVLTIMCELATLNAASTHQHAHPAGCVSCHPRKQKTVKVSTPLPSKEAEPAPSPAEPPTQVVAGSDDKFYTVAFTKKSDAYGVYSFSKDSVSLDVLVTDLFLYVVVPEKSVVVMPVRSILDKWGQMLFDFSDLESSCAVSETDSLRWVCGAYFAIIPNTKTLHVYTADGSQHLVLTLDAAKSMDEIKPNEIPDSYYFHKDSFDSIGVPPVPVVNHGACGSTPPFFGFGNCLGCVDPSATSDPKQKVVNKSGKTTRL